MNELESALKIKEELVKYKEKMPNLSMTTIAYRISAFQNLQNSDIVKLKIEAKNLGVTILKLEEYNHKHDFQKKDLKNIIIATLD